MIANTQGPLYFSGFQLTYLNLGTFANVLEDASYYFINLQFNVVFYRC